MPLDANLYVLALHSRPGALGTLDLREEGKSDNIYTARKEGDKIQLLDPWTDDTLYASLSILGPKLQLVTFEAPEALVEIKNSGNLGWEWSFEFEEHKFKWERSATSLLGGDRAYTLSVSMKPDPDFPVCIFSPASKRKPAAVQLLDYNISRVEPRIDDKKGFEILTILSLLSFLDHLFHSPSSPGVSPSITAGAVSMDPLTQAHLARNQSPLENGMSALALGGGRPEPPTPPRRSSGGHPVRQSSGGGGGGGRVMPGPSPISGLSSNEIEVRDPARREEDGQRCLKLLEDDSLLWILLIGQSAQIVPHVVALAETVKRQRYKASGEELKQFIDDDGGGPSSGDKYATPSSIKIYLSRIDDLAAFLPHYKPKIVPPKPPIRPPIVFGSSPSQPSAEKEKERNAKLKKGSKEEGGGGGGGGIFGFGRR